MIRLRRKIRCRPPSGCEVLRDCLRQPGMESEVVFDARRSGGFLRQLRKLWQLIGNVEPRRFVCDEYMKPGFDAGIIIERAKRKAVRGRIAVEAAEKRCAADTAEASVVPWRGLIVRHQCFTLNPSEISGSDARAAAESRAVRLSTHRAVAVERARQRARDLVPNPTAKATAAQHGSSLWFRVSRAERQRGRAAVPAKCRCQSRGDMAFIFPGACQS